LAAGWFFGDWLCGWGWLIGFNQMKRISCQAGEGELQPVRQGWKET
jgi:hypothetical protein